MSAADGGDGEKAPIVIDNGTTLIRAGFAGDDYDYLPTCTFPNIVGTVRQEVSRPFA